jgi:hypothetical protein
LREGKRVEREEEGGGRGGNVTRVEGEVAHRGSQFPIHSRNALVNIQQYCEIGNINAYKQPLS